MSSIKPGDPLYGLGKFYLDAIKDNQIEEYSHKMEKIELEKEDKENLEKIDGLILRANKPAFRFFFDEMLPIIKMDKPGLGRIENLKV
jgi:hypothetical protein